MKGRSFRKKGPSFIETDDVPLQNPFDTPNDLGANPFGQNPFLTPAEGPQFDQAERTQPIPRRTLNLARPMDTGGAPPFLPPARR